MAAIAAVLSSYDTDLIREVTDPRTGIAATEKYMSFMPNAGELKVYCDGIAARRDRIRRLGELPAPDFSRARLSAPRRAPGDLATVFVPASNPRYAALVELSKEADARLFKFEERPGIWISWDTWDNRMATAPRSRAADEMHKLQLTAEAKRAMADVDAERTGNLAVDQGAYAEAGE